MRVPAAIAEILKREGVEIVFGYPVNPIFDAVAAADIRPIVVRQERIGIHMADAFSRMRSGQQIGVFTMQSGPGTENAFGAVAQAFSESVPLVVIAGGYARNQTNVFPYFSGLVNYKHITKSTEQLTDAAFLPDMMRRAQDFLVRRGVLDTQASWQDVFSQAPSTAAAVTSLTASSMK